jgi:hypothetical protein
MGFETSHSGLPPIEELLASDADAVISQSTDTQIP